MGTECNGNTVYLLDFGLARNFVDPDTGTHIPSIDKRTDHLGTREFCSANVNMHQGQSEPSVMTSLFAY